MKKFLLTVLVLIIIISAALFIVFRTSKNIGVNYTEEDYNSYKGKVAAFVESNGTFSLTDAYNGNFTSEGKKKAEMTLSNQEVSAAIDYQNNFNGPIKDVKIKLLNNNETEITFKLTKEIDSYIPRTEETLSRYPFITKSLENTPVYIKTSINTSSATSITADISSLKLGQMKLPEKITQGVEAVVVESVNKIISNYKNFSIEELKIEDGQLYFKGTVPTKLEGNNK